MNFNINHPVLFLMVAIIIFIVLAQSIFFLVKAWRRGKEIGMDKKKLRHIAISAGVFTIAPAVAILVSVIALSKKLGFALPWLRLSVVGSNTYETVAANNTLSGMGLSLEDSNLNLNASQFVTITLVMTISIMVGIWLVPVLCKRMKTGLVSMKNKDAKWLDIFQSAMFIGMISAFVGFVFCNVWRLWNEGARVVDGVTFSATSGLIPVLVMAVSAVTMLIAGLLLKITKARWINDYALPASLVVGMASAIPLTAWLG